MKDHFMQNFLIPFLCNNSQTSYTQTTEKEKEIQIQSFFIVKMVSDSVGYHFHFFQHEFACFYCCWSTKTILQNKMPK